MSEQEPFRLVVLGDSIQWGQGLVEGQKFSEMVRQTISRELGRPAMLVHRYAHSGACIGREEDGIDGQGQPTAGNSDPGSLLGELPNATPTIHAQLNALLLDETIDNDSTDLILVDGGINPDHSGGPEATDPFSKVLHPFTEVEALRADTVKACYENMRGLLTRISSSLPNARTVVTGYYPIFSQQSDLARSLPWLQVAVIAFPLLALVEGIVLRKLTELSNVWAEESAAALRQAVDEVNAQLGDTPRLGYAHVPFGPENCLLAPKSWLWGLSPLLGAEDPVAAPRLQLCEEQGRSRDPFSIWASVGHPNREGAQQYHRAVVHTLRQLGILPKQPSLVDSVISRIGAYVDRFRRSGAG